MAKKPANIDEYLAGVKPEQRAALERLRATIHAAVPGAEECISYGLAAFRKGKMLVGFGAGKEHCAFYVMSSTTLRGFEDELRGYDVSTSTIRFPPDKPLPVALVRKLVKARLAENAAC
ncbi:MAG: DUF1801 domain-containing protein [Acidobacteria bacterium]|nr:DUF1801 domain-containing protein [Acidobacteriota bacterium]